MRDHVRFFLNGLERTAHGDDVFRPLTSLLRDQQGLTGTKVVCAEGDCGACTVLVGRPEAERVRYEPVDACLLFLYQIDGTHVVTVEGLPTNGMLHPAQQAMVDHHGSQCGYCTPGFVMALAGWAENGATTDPAAMRVALTGNLCRCTGYVPILQAAAALAQTAPASLDKRYDERKLLDALRGLASDPLHVGGPERTYFAPASIEEATAFLAQRPDAVLVSGGTELGVLRNKRGIDPPRLLSLSRIKGLDTIVEDGGCWHVGANATWTQVGRFVRELVPEFHRVIERFGSPQIRNVATLVGNVAHGSPIADSLGYLLVMDAELTIVGPRGVRQRPLNGFYTGYKKKDLAPGELISKVSVPLPVAEERLRLYKISRRRDLDIATFGAGIRIVERGGMVRQAAIAYTGVAATAVRLPKTEAFLKGRPFAETTFDEAGRIARGETEPLTDVRGSRDFRLLLAENILKKFYADETCSELESARAES